MFRLTTVGFWVPEEKGSDVNLASHLLVDGFTGKYEVAVVVSNDADLLEPHPRLVRAVLGLPVGVVKVGRAARLRLRQAGRLRADGASRTVRSRAAASRADGRPRAPDLEARRVVTEAPTRAPSPRISAPGGVASS